MNLENERGVGRLVIYWDVVWWELDWVSEVVFSDEVIGSAVRGVVIKGGWIKQTDRVDEHSLFRRNFFVDEGEGLVYGCGKGEDVV